MSNYVTIPVQICSYHVSGYYNIKMILEGIITCLRTDIGCLKPEMDV